MEGESLASAKTLRRDALAEPGFTNRLTIEWSRDWLCRGFACEDRSVSRGSVTARRKRRPYNFCKDYCETISKIGSNKRGTEV